jgi:AAA domain
MPEPVTRPFRPIQNHSSSPCRWRAQARRGRERTPRLVKWAVQVTRKVKEHETPATLYDPWRAEASERGMDPDTLVREVTGRTADRDQALSERTVEERRWSTPELLGVEQRLVAAATGRAGEQSAAVSHEAVLAALAAHPSAGEDQAGMVRDLCQGGAGVALVVGRAGTGKTFALEMARHAWQLGGYRPLATAPTGIATVSLEAEGFEEVATCDRLLADLNQGRERLDGRTVLVVDEAGMLGSRKLAASSSMPSRRRQR